MPRTFTKQDLLALIENSPTVKALSQADRDAIIKIAEDPGSAGAQRIYEILLEEKVKMANVATMFNKIASRVMDEMQVGIVDIKTKAGKKKMLAAQQKAKKEEQKEAESLLHALE